MRRRELLSVGGAVLFADAAGAHPTLTGTRSGSTPGTPAGTATGTAGSSGGSAAATPPGYGPLGTVNLPKAKEAVVGRDGTTVFVAVTDGFAVVDAADPRSPRVIYEDRSPLSDLSGGPLKAVFDVKVDGDRLAVTGPAGPAGGDALKGVAVYDVSDPASPERVTVHRTDGFNHNCFIRDGIVYLCFNDPGGSDPNAVVTVDAESGEELGRWSIADVEPAWTDVSFPLWPVHDVWVHGGIAYLAHWDAGTWMVDVSDPANPELAGRVRGRTPSAFADLSKEAVGREADQPPGNDHISQASEDGTLVVVGVEAWDAETGDDTGHPGGIHLYDVSTPGDPEELSSIPAPPTPDATKNGVWTTSHNFELVGDRLYTSWYRGGIRVYDVSEPSRPDLLAAWRDSATTSFWTAQQADDFVVASSRKDPSGETPSKREEGAALYTFPEPPGTTPTPTRTATPTGTGDADGVGDGQRGDTSTGEDPTASDAPGFGPVAALAGVGLGAWRYWRRRGT